MPEAISSKLLDATLLQKSPHASPISVYHTLSDLEHFYGMAPTEIELLGEGSYSMVKKVKHPMTQGTYALKFVTCTQPEAETVVANEVKTLQILHHLGGHPSIIDLHGLFELETGVGLLLDLCSGGDLLDFLNAHHKALSTHVSQSIAYQFFDAIKFLHDSEIVHRDLKLENVLIHHLDWHPLPLTSGYSLTSVPTNVRIKLTDFGFSRKIRKGEFLHERSGSLEYSSPEIILSKPHDPYASDLWSAGVVFFVLMTGLQPFSEVDQDVVIDSTPSSSSTNPSSSSSCSSLTRKRSLVKAGRKSLVHRIARVEYYYPEPPPTQYSGEILLNLETRLLIESLVCLYPEKRLSATEVLERPWIAQGKP
ncbi:hypothetical protein HMI56_000313 [Coelomomyces lativittatus]|nr:hypothetical protein HMI56_000313 [Coelomomyces lativittatus]